MFIARSVCCLNNNRNKKERENYEGLERHKISGLPFLKIELLTFPNPTNTFSGLLKEDLACKFLMRRQIVQSGT